MGACVCIEVYDENVLNGFQEFAYERGVFQQTVSEIYVCNGTVYYN